MTGDPHGQDEYAEDPDEEGLCARCGGDGYLLACDGDGSDWGEDTYAGPMDAVIKCRCCNGGNLE